MAGAPPPAPAPHDGAAAAARPSVRLRGARSRPSSVRLRGARSRPSSVRLRGARSRPSSVRVRGARPRFSSVRVRGARSGLSSVRVRGARSRGMSSWESGNVPVGKKPTGPWNVPGMSPGMSPWEGALQAHPAPAQDTARSRGVSRGVPRGDTSGMRLPVTALAPPHAVGARTRRANRRAAGQRAGGTWGWHCGGDKPAAGDSASGVAHWWHPLGDKLAAGDSASGVAHWWRPLRSVAMLRCHVVAVHIPGATGFGPGVLLSVCFRGVPRRTQVVPEERSLTWNEELVWPLDTCPLRATDTLGLHLRRGDCLLPREDLGATTVSLSELVASPRLPMAVRDIPLLDHRERPTGCTVTLRCYHDLHGAAGDVPVATGHGQVALEPPGVAPEDRKEDFQVRVRVIKGRQLRGNAIKPVVRVQIGRQRFHSRSRSGNNPYFNEVLRSPNICTKAVIGIFEAWLRRHRRGDGGVPGVPGGTGRSLSGKWLSLQHPRHRDGRSQGFLQVSLVVRRAGERAQEREVPPGDEDVEANLLRPPPCATTLQIRVFRAEDLPRGGDAGVWRGDIGVREPARACLGGTAGSLKVSVRVGFAGRTLCTRGVPADASPEWNEVLSFPLRLPPICDEILLEILRGSCRSKALGRATLRLSQISREPKELEEGTPGFSPSFGPSFLPFYGPRPDAARDSGPVFRGRLLLELCTHTGSPPGRQRDAVAPVDAERAQSRLPRCQLGLCGVFYSATAVPGGAEALSLELGMGGTAAATAPALPAFDGNLYHYLPWFGDKPVAAVTSQWEDAGHRWDSLNLLRALCQHLEENLAKLQGHHGDASGDIGVKLLQELEQDCEAALQYLEEQPVLTALDQQLRSCRRRLLQRLQREARADGRRGDALGTVARGWLRRAAALAVEPQAGVPDVQLWLLRGQARVASARVPATDVLHSPHGPGACGQLCGRIVTLFLGCGDSQAQVRVWLWLGRVAESGELAGLLGGSLRFYCQMFENQTRLLGTWGPRRFWGRPAFSDSSGRALPPPEELRPPKGWSWDGPWSVERPRRRVPARAEGAGTVVLEELYENQSREPGGDWTSTASTDAVSGGQRGDSVGGTRVSLLSARLVLQKGVAVPPKEEVACPQGWHVTSDWQVDTEGAEDEDGWHYGVGTEDGSPPAAWHSEGQQCHTLRRRRWLRVCHRDSDGWAQDTDTCSSLVTLAGTGTGVTGMEDPEELWEDEAWQPECFWGCTFQPKVPAGPRCRRRRWQRCLVPAEPGAAVAPLFLLRGAPDTEEPAQDSAEVALQQPPPFILCSFQRPGRFQLRCYIFQALDLAPGSSRTSIDATAHVSFVSLSQRTGTARGALDPRWEQTLLFPRVPLFGDPRGVGRDPPAVVVEVWDQRGQGPAVLLGRCVCSPRVWLDAALREPPRLQPHALRGPRGAAGELLAAFELLQEPQDGSPAPLGPPPLSKDGFGIPPELRPRLHWVALEVGATCGRGQRGDSRGDSRGDEGATGNGVLAWGLRGLRGAVREPRLELQWGEQSLWTPPIQDVATNPNFPSNAFLLTLVRAGAGPGVAAVAGPSLIRPRPCPQALPEHERFVPPIRLRLWHRAGAERRLLLGQASVRELGRYRCPPPCQEPGNGSDTVVSMPDELLSVPASSSPCRRWCSRFLAMSPARMAQDLLGYLRSRRAEDEDEEDEDEEDEDDEEEEERDWWSKFYASMEDKEPKSPWGTNGDRLKIYGCELEAVPEFQALQDFCQSFPLCKPGRAPEPVGTFKGLFRIYPVPEGAAAPPGPRCFQRLPPARPQPCLLRVYVVRAFDLSPRDVTGLSDPYVRVALGKRTLGQRDHYVPNTLEPVFGRMFELTATIPLEKDLRVTIMDHDKVPPDREIGSTTIDLEDRLLSQHRAHCGLPGLYHTAGPACWRDQLCPSRALELLAAARGLRGPLFSRGGTALSLGGRRFLLKHFERRHPPPRHAGAPRERLALHVLNLCELVPEHLETRGLQSHTRPGLEQGKVQMWVDIFPTSLGPPGPPVNIDPRQAEGYELRCVVWNVQDTELRDINLLGQRMSDIYVSGWLDGLPEQRQHTDIHYRSLDGRGAFNWRFVFPFEFLAAEKLCAIRRKEHVWSLDETLLKVPPKLILQVWDNDKFKADDLLGILELELTRLPRPARSARLCRASPSELPWFSWPWFSLPRFLRPLNLFRRRRARGWWPCTMHEDGGQRLSGKLELSLELLSAQEAEERPVGKGREEPNKHPTLPEPRRPKSSFLWLTSPLRLIRYGVRWRYLLWLGLGLAALLLLLLLHSFFPSTLRVKVAEALPLLPATKHPRTEG
ncbi:fer-1-like protein 5 [Melospiza melodia melodia]|uniref:fer-1-like protein 5 n=1 Tax=Melospiza melodia melodia TaxID=1914991 RepID=UPI002FD2E651